jgi:hypothetical protein
MVPVVQDPSSSCLTPGFLLLSRYSQSSNFGNFPDILRRYI